MTPRQALRRSSLRLGLSAALIAELALAAASQTSCEEALLFASNPSPEARLGFSVAIEGDLAAVGAPFGNGATTLSGAVYVYERGTGGWVFAAKLSASDGAAGDGFGNEIAINNERILVGAVWKDGPGVDAGAAYLFERAPGSTWIQTAVLKPSDHAPSDWFGRALDLDGGRLVIGASLKADPAFATGAAYVFEQGPGSVWTETAKLSASDGAGEDFFGGALDLDGARVLIGAHGGDTFGSESGGAYVYDLAGGAWVESAKLIGAFGKPNDDLGVEVALAGDVAMCASFGDEHAAPDGGSVYVFERGGGGWAQTDELVASDAGADDGFGAGLALDGNLAVIGAWHDDDGGADAGAAYTFERQSGVFVEVAKLPGGAPAGLAGFDVAVSGATVISGAPESSAAAAFAGEARIARVAAGGSLFGCPAWISLSAGGAQALRVDAGGLFAGKLYYLAGSASGSAPGFVFQGLHVPLNPDFYFLFTVAHPNTPPLAASLGLLDGAGAATAGFALPPGFDPSLAGVLLHHAALLLDPVLLTALVSTEAEPLALLP